MNLLRSVLESHGWILQITCSGYVESLRPPRTRLSLDHSFGCGRMMTTLSIYLISKDRPIFISQPQKRVYRNEFELDYVCDGASWKRAASRVGSSFCGLPRGAMLHESKTHKLVAKLRYFSAHR